jgi:hypothetical protein
MRKTELLRQILMLPEHADIGMRLGEHSLNITNVSGGESAGITAISATCATSWPPGT